MEYHKIFRTLGAALIYEKHTKMAFTSKCSDTYSNTLIKIYNLLSFEDAFEAE